MYRVIASASSIPEQQTRFRLEDRSYESLHPSIALSRLFDKTSESGTDRKIDLFLLDENEHGFDREKYRLEAERAGVTDIRFHRVSSVQPARELSSLFRTFREFSGEEPLLLDVTDGPGILAVLLFCTVGIYRQVDERKSHLYSGHADGDMNEIRFHDATWLYDMGHLSAGITRFLKNESGELLSEGLQKIHEETYRNDSPVKSKNLQNLASIVRTYDKFLHSGLCLEVGLSTKGHGDEYWKNVEEDMENLAPYLKEGVGDLRSSLESIALPAEVDKKEDIELTGKELERQIEVGNRLVESGNFSSAYLLARELLVNASILGDRERVPGSTWLDSEVRELYSGRYYMLNHWMVEEELRPLLSEFQQYVSSTWAALKQRRNVLAHISMNPERVQVDRMKGNLRELWQDVVTLVTEERNRLPEIREFSFEGTSLLFPYRNNSKPLELMLDTYDVDRLFVMVLEEDEDSEDLKTLIRETGLDGSVVDLTFHRDRNEFWRWEERWQNIRKNLLQSSRIVVSVSGGTSEMRYTLDKLFHQILNYGIPWVEAGYLPETQTEPTGEEDYDILEIQSSSEGDNYYPF